MIAVATALALWAGGLPSLFKATGFERIAPARGWVLEIKTDSFTGTRICTIKSRGVIYRHGVVAFRFGGWTDTANALYRIDQGKVQSAGEVATEAAGLGAHFRSQNLENPSDGRVFIPGHYLASADSITIRPNGRSTPRKFSLIGLGSSLVVASAKGCESGPSL